MTSSPTPYLVYDLCYFVNLLTLTYIWIFPSSKILFIVCYVLSHGPVALAIVLWKNSLVFHSECFAAHTFRRCLTLLALVSGLDKVTSLFIHMYGRRILLHSRRISFPFQVSSTDLVHHSLALTIRSAARTIPSYRSHRSVVSRRCGHFLHHCLLLDLAIALLRLHRLRTAREGFTWITNDLIHVATSR